MLQHYICIMKITVLRKDEQVHGEFNAGAILERKPLGFPQDHGSLTPYGNLFYWAHAWSSAGGMIGEHPHRGFEILSFILKGTTHHYDSKLQGWKELNAGNVQIICAGRGISHAERMEAGAELFQIWFDPGLERTMTDEATYNDHRAADFPVLTDADGRTVVYVGQGSPLTLRTEPLAIKRVSYNNGTYPIKADGHVSAFILGGEVMIDGHQLTVGDFFRVSGTGTTSITTSGADVFIIECPDTLPYRTYRELMRG